MVMAWNERCPICEKLFKCGECGRNEHSHDVDEYDGEYDDE